MLVIDLDLGRPGLDVNFRAKIMENFLPDI